MSPYGDIPLCSTLSHGVGIQGPKTWDPRAIVHVTKSRYENVGLLDDPSRALASMDL